MPIRHGSVVLSTLVACPILYWGTSPVAAQDRLAEPNAQIRASAEQSEQPADPPTDHPEPGYVGVIADDRREAGGGVRIIHVVPDGPAHHGGIRVGDRITAIDRVPILRMEDLARVMTTNGADTVLRVEIERDGGAHELIVTLETRPPENGRLFSQFGRVPESVATPSPQSGTALASPTTLGLQIAPLTEVARRRWNLPVRAGVLVISVVAGSPADRAGVPSGSVVLEVNGQAVPSPDHLRRLVAAGEPGPRLDVTYYHLGQTLRVEVPFDRSSAEAGGSSRPPATLPHPTTADAMQRIERLERRVEQLERRFDQRDE